MRNPDFNGHVEIDVKVKVIRGGAKRFYATGMDRIRKLVEDCLTTKGLRGYFDGVEIRFELGSVCVIACGEARCGVLDADGGE